MNSQIASLHDRMSQGGNWQEFRDEIATLHRSASTENEYVALLEAHAKLRAVAPHAFDAETCAKITSIANAEYRLFLIKEATENGVANPVLLDRVTAREVEAGRLHADDEFRKHAEAGALLGDSAVLFTHLCTRGSWFFYGALAAAGLGFVFQAAGVSPLWTVAPALFVGWALNNDEQKKAKAKVEAARSERFNASPA